MRHLVVKATLSSFNRIKIGGLNMHYINQLIKLHKGIYLSIHDGYPNISFINPAFIKLLNSDELAYVLPRIMDVQMGIMMSPSIKTIVDRTLPFIEVCDNETLVASLTREIVKRADVESLDMYLDSLIEMHFNNVNHIEDLYLSGCYTEHALDDVHSMLDGIYFHGELETKMGYDIVYINRPKDEVRLLLAGECKLKPIQVRNETTGEIFNAYLTYWQGKWRIRGYVYLQTDVHALQLAHRNYFIRADHL